MEHENVLNQFGALEKKIEKLIGTCIRLEKEKVELANKMEDLSAQLKDKADIERANDELKGTIRSKIDSLMGRLDEYIGDKEAIR